MSTALAIGHQAWISARVLWSAPFVVRFRGVLQALLATLLLAALMGVLIPMTLMRLGRDPAMGASVMITAMTDSGGFFIFLGLASIFLL